MTVVFFFEFGAFLVEAFLPGTWAENPGTWAENPGTWAENPGSLFLEILCFSEIVETCSKPESFRKFRLDESEFPS